MTSAPLRLAAVATILAGVLVVSGCGGGGAGGTVAATTTTTLAGVALVPSVSVALVDPSSGAARNSIALGSPATVTATVLDPAGKPMTNMFVTFSTTPTGQVSITPVAGTALTGDGNNGTVAGVARVQIDPASLTSSGAATVTATVTGASQSTSFSIGAASLGLSGLNAGSTVLSAYGTRSVTVNVTGVPTTTSIAVNFSSLCTSTGKASLPASVQSVNGVAIATYKDNGCGATDTITANIAGTTVTKTADLAVAAPSIASIQFVSATPSTIVLKGTGGAGLSESSIVVFKVLDNNNQPIASKDVTLDLTTRTGGILLDNTSAGSVTKQTDANGLVQVAVQAGTNPTAVWVNAVVSSSSLTFNSQSTVLRISTGRPAQDRFSLAVKTHAIEGWSHDGITTTLTAYASDRLANPVPEGTAINFIAEGGQVQPSCATVDGRCSVVFTSANPRPFGETPAVDAAVTAVTAGRVTVLAYALGEESFIDPNGNNIFDGSDTYNDLGDAYVDFNENQQWDSGEPFIPFAAGTSACQRPNINSSPYAPSKAGSCDGHWGQAHVRQENLIIFSGSDAYLTVYSGGLANLGKPTPPVGGASPASTYVLPNFSMGGACEKTVGFWLFDLNRNPMPAGSVVTLVNLSRAVSSGVVGGTPVPDSTNPGGTLISATVKLGDLYCPLVGSATAELKVTTPLGLTSSYTLVLIP